MALFICSFLADLDSPALLIGQDTGLNAGDGVIQLLTQVTDLAAIDDHHIILVAQLADRRNNGSGTGAEAFFQSAVALSFQQFIGRNLPLLNLITPVLAELDGGVAGDAGQNGTVQSRCDHLAGDLEEDVHCTDFFDILPLYAVQPQDLGITCIMCLLLCDEGSRIVTAGLGKTHAAADCTDIFIFDPDTDRSQTAFVVRMTMNR